MFLDIDWNQLLILTAINGVGALGYYITLSSGQLSIGHGALYMLGAYIAGLVSLQLDLPVPGLLLIGFAMTFVCGFLLATVTIRLRSLYFAVATYGFGGAIVEMVQHLKILNGPFGLGGVPMFTSLPLSLVVLVIVALIAWQWDRSLLYLLSSIIRTDQDIALVLGIDVRQMRRLAFALGAGLVGVSGVLYVGNTTIVSPSDGSFEQSLGLLLMVVIGGTRSWLGPLLGAAIWTMFPELLRFTSTGRFVVFGAMAILLMAIRPEGVLGRMRPSRWNRRDY